MNTINTFTQEIQTHAINDTTTFLGLTLDTWFWILFFAMIAIAVITVSVQKAFHEKNAKYAVKQTSSQKTGAQVAQEMLTKNGITDVRVISGQEGHDHFNPETKTISLSPSTFNSSSISAMAIAAHEVGHAIQWHKKSIMVRVRNVLTTPVQIATGIGQAMFAMGGLLMMLVMGFQTWAVWITIAGLIMYAAMGLFQLVTLPLEFNASSRAIKNLKEMELIKTEDDLKGSKAVLKAAAMTYVVAFISTMITLAFFILRLIMMKNRNN